MLQKTTLIVLLLAIVSCKKAETVEKDKIKLADWLIGNWENKSPDGILTENWKKVNDSTFSAVSLFIKGKDTLHSEKIILSQQGEMLMYSATVNGQNNDKAIDFPSTTETENKLIFENPSHDYPQKITYSKGANNTLTAEISGDLRGKKTTERFIMVKK
ncbi:hypothetical protein AR687_09800 [Flavobacteriaceae bacterium CRH]|nr:hypothetical protein AR687_09800 [Flavobacteriaceae bacterium CRH]